MFLMNKRDILMWVSWILIKGGGGGGDTWRHAS